MFIATQKVSRRLGRISFATAFVFRDAHVPAVSLLDYSATEPWSDFGQVVAINEGDGIEQLTSETITNPTVYGLNGCCTAKMQQGISILRNADGRVKKVLRK